MKTILFILFSCLTFGQVKIDSSYAEYKGNAVYEMHGYATFQKPVSVNDYRIGFRLSQNTDENTYVPMGSYTLSTGNREIEWLVEIVNPPFGNKFFFESSIIPIAEQKKFEVTDIIGRLINLYDEPVIESNLPEVKNAIVNDMVQFDISATGENLEYEWFMRTMNTDSTFNEFDSTWTYQFIWNEAIKIGGATSSSYQTTPVHLNWNGRKYFIRVYNNLGEEYSRQTLLIVFEGI